MECEKMCEKVKKLEIRITLKDKLAEMFLAIKDHYCLKNNAEVIRLLIRKTYDKIMKEAE